MAVHEMAGAEAVSECAPAGVSPRDSRSGAPKKFPPAIALSAQHHGLVVLDVFSASPMIPMGALERVAAKGTYHA